MAHSVKGDTACRARHCQHHAEDFQKALNHAHTPTSRAAVLNAYVYHIQPPYQPPQNAPYDPYASATLKGLREASEANVLSSQESQKWIQLLQAAKTNEHVSKILSDLQTTLREMMSSSYNSRSNPPSQALQDLKESVDALVRKCYGPSYTLDRNSYYGIHPDQFSKDLKQVCVSPTPELITKIQQAFEFTAISKRPVSQGAVLRVESPLTLESTAPTLEEVLNILKPLLDQSKPEVTGAQDQEPSLARKQLSAKFVAYDEAIRMSNFADVIHSIQNALEQNFKHPTLPEATITDITTKLDTLRRNDVNHLSWNLAPSQVNPNDVKSLLQIGDFVLEKCSDQLASHRLATAMYMFAFMLQKNDHLPEFDNLCTQAAKVAVELPTRSTNQVQRDELTEQIGKITDQIEEQQVKIQEVRQTAQTRLNEITALTSPSPLHERLLQSTIEDVKNEQNNLKELIEQKEDLLTEEVLLIATQELSPTQELLSQIQTTKELIKNYALLRTALKADPHNPILQKQVSDVRASLTEETNKLKTWGQENRQKIAQAPSIAAPIRTQTRVTQNLIEQYRRAQAALKANPHNPTLQQQLLNVRTSLTEETDKLKTLRQNNTEKVAQAVEPPQKKLKEAFENLLKAQNDSLLAALTSLKIAAYAVINTSTHLVPHIQMVETDQVPDSLNKDQIQALIKLPNQTRKPELDKLQQAAERIGFIALRKLVDDIRTTKAQNQQEKSKAARKLKPVNKQQAEPSIAQPASALSTPTAITLTALLPAQLLAQSGMLSVSAEFIEWEKSSSERLKTQSTPSLRGIIQSLKEALSNAVIFDEQIKTTLVTSMTPYAEREGFTVTTTSEEVLMLRSMIVRIWHQEKSQSSAHDISHEMLRLYRYLKQAKQQS